MAFDLPARQAFIVEMTSRDDLMNAISLNSAIFNGARIIGPAVAGVLIAKVSLAWCFFLNGLSFLAVIVGLLMMRLPEQARRTSNGSTWQHAAEGLSFVLGHRRVRVLLALLAVVVIFGWSYAVLMPAFARDVMRASARGYGVLLSAHGVGALLGALVVATLGHRLRPRPAVLGGLTLFSVAIIGLAATTSFLAAIICLVASGLGLMTFMATTNTLVQTSVPDEMRGRVMGVWTLVFGGMMPVGSLTAGAVAQGLGVRWAIGIGALVCGAATVAAAWWARRPAREREP